MRNVVLDSHPKPFLFFPSPVFTPDLLKQGLPVDENFPFPQRWLPGPELKQFWVRTQRKKAVGKGQGLAEDQYLRTKSSSTGR